MKNDTNSKLVNVIAIAFVVLVSVATLALLVSF